MNREAGITLIELMVAVAIVGILAGLAVYMFGKTTDKAKASEVRVMFSELKTRQEAHHVENNEYLETAATDSLGNMHPTPPSGSNTKQAVHPMPASWTELRMNPKDSNVYCSYVALAGPQGTAAAGPRGTAAPFSFNGTAPVQDWYYLLAQCDWDNSGNGNDTLYFTRSDRDGMLISNDGN